MSELLSKFDPIEFVIWTAVAGGLLVGLVSAVTAIVGAFWESIRESQMTTTLIQDMLDRGVPTEEIVDVVLAFGVEEPEDKMFYRVEPRTESPQAEPSLTS
ncbi:MAG: hypothetical protein ACYSWU_09380 [Planctomycetota bacterium]|jgi:RsiW-degrading membrane proteinase PrsW (M82 family)